MLLVRCDFLCGIAIFVFLNVSDLLCEHNFAKSNFQYEKIRHTAPKEVPDADRIHFEDLQFDVTVRDDENEPVFSFDKYYRTTEIYQLMDYLQFKYRDLVEIFVIGHTWEKRPIRTMKISSKNANNSAIWIDGGIHAREWISVSSVCYIMYTLLTNWENLNPVFRNVDYYVTPVLNPDGYEFSHGKHTRLWRKNRRKMDYCYGVDLNRNFPFKWGNGHYTVHSFGLKNCGEEFGGTGPQSEPETRAVTDFILQFPNKFKGFLSFHTYGQSILYPYGYEPRVPKDASRFKYVGQLAANKILEVTGFQYEVTTGSMLSYSFPGNSMDWAYKVANISYSYLVELRNTTSFVLPPSDIVPAGKEALIIAMTLVDNFELNVAPLTPPDDLFDEVIIESRK